jgi:hypothetical protein
MARKLIHREAVGRCFVRVYKDSEWQEYIVRFMPKSASDDGTYHTDAQDDAINTAKATLQRMQADGICGTASLGRARSRKHKRPARRLRCPIC